MACSELPVGGLFLKRLLNRRFLILLCVLWFIPYSQLGSVMACIFQIKDKFFIPTFLIRSRASSMMF